jgi:5-methylcytosine-specific restriction protein A
MNLVHMMASDIGIAFRNAPKGTINFLKITTLPKHPCAKGGCPELVPGADRYCSSHSYDRDRSGDKVRRLYSVVQWHYTRLSVFARDRICQDCHAYVCEEVHHIVPARKYMNIHGDNAFFDECNLIGLCKPCHSKRTAAER